jgi:hypothetical protein
MQDIGLCPISISVVMCTSPVIKLPDGPCLGLNLIWVTVFITLINYTDKRQDGSTSTDQESSSNRSRPDGSRYRVSHSTLESSRS